MADHINEKHSGKFPSQDVDSNSISQLEPDDHRSEGETLPVHPAPPFTGGFFDEGAAGARAIYFKILSRGALMVTIAIFAVLSIFWGALWRVDANIHNLKGWVVDFDGSLMGQTVTRALISIDQPHAMTWEWRSASDFPNGPSDLATAVVDERAWAVVVVNPSSTARLDAAMVTVDSSYNGSQAITVYVNEARQETGYRSLIYPNIVQALQTITQQFAIQFAGQLTSQSNIGIILSNAPQIITQPMYYTMHNLRPFDHSVASAVTVIGLIYLLIVAFLVTSLASAARLASGFERQLKLGSIIRLRMVTSVVMYFWLSLMYSMLSLAFQLPFNRRFGPSGFLIYWMLSFCAMAALGLAIESLITILTPAFIPFFLILWIIVNISVCVVPIQVMPVLYRYGYATPFYNVSRAVRTIVFETKNQVGMNFGILLAWIAISCITLPFLQWFVRRREMRQIEAAQTKQKSP